MVEGADADDGEPGGEDPQLDGDALAALAEALLQFEEPVLGEDEAPVSSEAFDSTEIEVPAEGPLESAVVAAEDPATTDAEISNHRADADTATEEDPASLDSASADDEQGLLSTLSGWLGGSSDTAESVALDDSTDELETTTIEADSVVGDDGPSIDLPLPDEIVVSEPQPLDDEGGSVEVAAGESEPDVDVTDAQGTGVVGSLLGWLAGGASAEDEGAASEPDVMVEVRQEASVDVTEPEPEVVQMVELQAVEPEVVSEREDVIAADEVPPSVPSDDESSGTSLGSLLGWLSGSDTDEPESAETSTESDTVVMSSSQSAVEEPAETQETLPFALPEPAGEAAAAAEQPESSGGSGLLGALGGFLGLGGGDEARRRRKTGRSRCKPHSTRSERTSVPRFSASATTTGSGC